MTYYDPFVDEVRQNREKLLELYGGFEGYMQHVDEERPVLKKQAGISPPKKNWPPSNGGTQRRADRSAKGKIQCVIPR